ncbi:MAG: hypothetical protein EZS28_041509 [Streblomastix strix]|uniref:Uncharacterized protein n=1 Tax=Streblomastix strix TaxID=222440 RepID=A0A5J4TXD0_9EUKA|nr:MAG: hypothetical protein EZS28_041509 [Streblomastix strix]
MSKKSKKRLIPAYVQPVTWEEEMAIKDPMTVDGQEVNPSNVGRVPQMLKTKGIKLKKRLDQPSMYLGRSSPGLSPEQINNEIMYSGSYKQKEKENQRMDDIYDIQTQQDLGQSSSFEDYTPTMPLMQEKLIEKQQQAIEKDLASQENLAQIYDVGALDWGRMPVNDQFNRQQFKTQKTGYQMNADGSISAIVKKENTKITPVEKKPKTQKNYIPTSQLLQSAKEQSSFKKKKHVKK